MERGRNGDGKFFCRVNLHPESDGQYCFFKKICFPDRSWTTPVSVWEGVATVSVVRELGKYAFLKGEMIKPRKVENLMELSEFFLNTESRWSFNTCKLLKINSPLRDDYFAVDSGSKRALLLIEPSEETHKYKFTHWEYIEDDIQAGYCVESSTLMEFVLK